MILIETKTINELWSYAKSWYGIEKEDARNILKENGHDSFKKENWFVYLNILREHWNHVIEAKEECPMESKRERLQRESDSVKMVATPDGWVYEGTSKALSAYWELQDLYRRENVKRCMKKLEPISQVGVLLDAEV